MFWTLGLSWNLIIQQSQFLVEPSVLAGLNLLLAYVLFALKRERLPRGNLILAGCLAGFLFSTKLSTVYFLPLPLVPLWIKSSDWDCFWRGLVVFLASFFLATMLINFPVFLSHQSFLNYLQGITSAFSIS